MHQNCYTVWSSCLELIREHTSEQSFKTWFAPIVPMSLDNYVLTIQVPSQFFYEWLEENYVHLLKQAIMQQLGPQGRLQYSVIVDRGNEQFQPKTVSLPAMKQASSRQPVTPNGTNYDRDYKSPFSLRAIDEVQQKSHLNPTYTFTTYIEGDCNRLARSAGMAVAERPGATSFNPLMIYGGVGLGKTHLVQAIGNEIKHGLNDKFVLYVTSENFTNQFIEALKGNNVQSFSNFYLQVDVLIIDDVQFLSGKEKTQEIFFHIFNHLHQSGKQIIMTSDCPPRELKGLQERLLSRFKWGLTADLQAPDLETRMAIIQRKMEADGIFIPTDVVEYLANSVDTNMRELEGVLVSLLAHASLNRRNIDLELAKSTLQNIVQEIDTEVNIDYIQKTVSAFFSITPEQMKGKSRKREFVVARQVAMYFAKEYTTHSLKSIGAHFGGRDHSTVIHAVQAVNDLMETDSKFKGSIQELTKKLKSKVAA
ncbi:chromosomal replication initiator protein DnaA [Cesiribacter sp. SM1]|uniref:chromosomal replication initiator protein DnaA n=1 Tax=Cesiribacter sp. SM1 TaxID=2861196 RepID=UPI001CD38EA7|nr:chromosomal replication initiator protein DnaA [Cesiribacter sp. SM1]